MTTKAQVAAALNKVAALAEAIRELRSIPGGELYAHVMGHFTLDEFNWTIDRLIGAGLVAREGDVLRWTGPLDA